MSAYVDEAKKAIRGRVWDLLVRERVAEPGAGAAAAGIETRTSR